MERARASGPTTARSKESASALDVDMSKVTPTAAAVRNNGSNI
jgi:hypothetical protein